jgi:hypothetical protein
MYLYRKRIPTYAIKITVAQPNQWRNPYKQGKIRNTGIE